MPILTSWGTMKIDDNLKVVCFRPINSFEEVLVLSLDVRFAWTDIVSPIAYRDAHVIESNTFFSRPCWVCAPIRQARTQRLQLL